MEKRVERNIARRILRAVARELGAVGFHQTKPTFVIRPGDLVTPFFHFHKFTFGPRFRIHLGVMNDTFVALALSGPSLEHTGQYSERKENVQHCIQEMVSYCRRDGVPWLERWSDLKALLDAQDSPDAPKISKRYPNALAGRFNVQAVALSESLLGLRSGKNTAMDYLVAQGRMPPIVDALNANDPCPVRDPRRSGSRSPDPRLTTRA